MVRGRKRRIDERDLQDGARQGATLHVQYQRASMESYDMIKDVLCSPLINAGTTPSEFGLMEQARSCERKP
jgi:hypothetical protein